MIDALATAFRRFPMVMLAAILGTACMMWIVEYDSSDLNVVIRLLLTAAIGVPLLLAGRLMRGDGTGMMWNTRLPEIVAILILVGLFFTFRVGEYNSLSLQSALLFALVNLSAHLLVAVGPFLNRSSDADFWEYNKTLFSNFVIGAVYSAILYAGLSIAILAVDNLFELRIDGKIYAHLFFFLAGVFNTAYFLFHFPAELRLAKDQRPEYHIALRNLVKYILIPIVTIYFVILYAYSLKILVQWELPRGWVGSLVLGFSVAGIFTWLLNYFLPESDDSALVAAYRKWFFPVLLPMTLLLFVAIGRRIGDYGVTEPRMLVATTGVWLLVMCLYFIIAKRPSIKAIPASLILFALACAIGPLSAGKVSARSQAHRLQHELEQAGMWQDGKMVPARDSLDEEIAGEISSILTYMNEWEHLDMLKGWTDKFSGTEKLSWSELEQVKEELGLKKFKARKHLAFSFEQPAGVSVVDYQHLWVIDAVASGRGANSITDNVLTLETPDGGELELDMTPLLQHLKEKFGENNSAKPAEEGAYEFQEGDWEFRFYVRTLYPDINDGDEINQLAGVLLGKRSGSAPQ